MIKCNYCEHTCVKVKGFIRCRSCNSIQTCQLCGEELKDNPKYLDDVLVCGYCYEGGKDE